MKTPVLEYLYYKETPIQVFFLQNTSGGCLCYYLFREPSNGHHFYQDNITVICSFTLLISLNIYSPITRCNICCHSQLLTTFFIFPYIKIRNVNKNVKPLAEAYLRPCQVHVMKPFCKNR